MADSAESAEATTTRTGRTRDADGRLVKMIDPYSLWMRDSSEPIESAALGDIARDLGISDGGRCSLRWRIWLAVTAVVITVGGIGAMVVIEGQPAVQDLISTLTNPAIFGAIIGGAIVPIFAARQQRMRKLRRVMLRHRVCPHCGYSLVGLPSQRGRCTCPECACVWPAEELGAADDRTDAEKPAAPPRTSSAILLVLLGLLLFGVFLGLYVFLH